MFSNLKPKQSDGGLQESLVLMFSSKLNSEDCWHQLKNEYTETLTALVLPSPDWGGRSSHGGQPWGTFERHEQRKSIKRGSESSSPGLWAGSQAQVGLHSLGEYHVYPPPVRTCCAAHLTCGVWLQRRLPGRRTYREELRALLLSCQTPGKAGEGVKKIRGNDWEKTEWGKLDEIDGKAVGE